MITNITEDDVKDQARILVAASPPDNSKLAIPLIVERYLGKGRVVMSLTDETWRWRYMVGDRPFHYGFWKNAMKWVREGRIESGKRFYINLEKEKYAYGEEVNIVVTAYDENLLPIKDPSIVVSVEPPDSNQRFDLEIPSSPDGKFGTYVQKFTPSSLGNYFLKVGNESDEKNIATADFEVYVPKREDDNPIIDVRMLTEISEKSGGEYFTIDQVSNLPKKVKEATVRHLNIIEDHIWDSPLIYLLFALLLTVEWILRKAFRML